ncbi:MAG: hypothetical protein JW723_03560 [Bacteroidales bacterium]|nr:hypothetical protein [Bacteroidales bacterium]
MTKNRLHHFITSSPGYTGSSSPGIFVFSVSPSDTPPYDAEQALCQKISGWCSPGLSVSQYLYSFVSKSSHTKGSCWVRQ